MKSLRYSRANRSKGAEINMAPLLDMVFILLIFFVVTTSFVKESGVDVHRPVAKTAVTKEKANMIIGVTAGGLIFIEGKTIEIRSVRTKMERFLAETPEGSVVVVADKKSETGIVVRILDACRMAGIQNISVAAKKTA